jgi:hypothetical protein
MRPALLHGRKAVVDGLDLNALRSLGKEIGRAIRARDEERGYARRVPRTLPGAAAPALRAAQGAGGLAPLGSYERSYGRVKGGAS